MRSSQLLCFVILSTASIILTDASIVDKSADENSPGNSSAQDSEQDREEKLSIASSKTYNFTRNSSRGPEQVTVDVLEYYLVIRDNPSSSENDDNTLDAQVTSVESSDGSKNSSRVLNSSRGALNNANYNKQIVGCYHLHSGRNLLLSRGPFVSEKLDQSLCRNRCLTVERNETKQFVHFGLRNSTECYCGGELPKRRLQFQMQRCEHPCAGDSGQHCGGDSEVLVLRMHSDQSWSSIDPFSEFPELI